MDMTRRAWPLGWIPSDDFINGRPTGLLRMDNVCLDETGALTLCTGTQRIGAPGVQFDGNIEGLYSKYFNNIKYRFIATNAGSVYIQRGENAEFDRAIMYGSSTAAFATAFGCVLISTGMVRVIFRGLTQSQVDAGESEQYWLGLGKPHTPKVVGIQAGRAVLVGSWGDGAVTLLTGTDLEYFLPSVSFNTTSEFGVIRYVSGPVLDLAKFDDGSDSTPDDRFTLEIRIGNTDELFGVRIDIYLDDTADIEENYYWYQWSNEIVTASPFTQGTDALSFLEAKRKDFVRVGDNPDLNWSTVRRAKVQVVVKGIINVLVGTMYFTGGEGSLTGSYEYAVINLQRFTNFLIQSGPSDPSEVVTVKNGKVGVTIDPADDAQVNEYWVYRRSADVSADFVGIDEAPKLDTFYRVKVLKEPGTFIDEMSDEDAMLEGVTMNFRVVSLNEINAEFMGISEPVNGRTLYITISDVYISNFNDPASYNPVHTFRLSGDVVDKNLWITKAGVNRVLVGTTRDVYELVGTFAELPDGSLDLSVRTLNVGFPPISRSFCNDKDKVYYMSADGWRTIEGTIMSRLGGDLDLLFRGQYDRYGVPGIQVYPNNLTIYPCVVYKNQFWCVNTMIDGTRRTFVYDMARNYWHLRTIEPLSMYVEEDGKLIAGFGGGQGNYMTENYLRQLDIGNTYDGVEGQNVLIQTVFDDNGQPRNRKDTFTLKLLATASRFREEWEEGEDRNVRVMMAKDGEAFKNLGDFWLGEVSFEKLVEAASLFNTGGATIEVLNLGKRFSFRFECPEAIYFKLWGFTLEYEARPEQLNYLRLLPTNMGSLTRKRWISYAFVIDTLGEDVRFTPTVDNIGKAGSVVNTENKLTYIHYFLENTEGTDVGGMLWSPEDWPFEFYGLNLDETVSEKLPSPAKFMVIPANDYGVPNRKRHSSYKFQINTRGGDVRYTPRLDGVDKSPPSIANSSEKRTHEHFFTVDTIGIDIGGTLESLNDVPFEFYGVIVPQHIEVLPPRLKEFRIPENNYGIPAKKRIRTMPMEINTNGQDVRFVPIIDGAAGTATVLRTDTRSTAFHYFTTDVFGIDFSGELFSSDDVPFEFYGLNKPEEVEIIPVGKKFDQIGPVDFERIGKLLAFRVRMICTGYLMTYTVYVEDTAVYSGDFGTFANCDKTYEVMQFPKTIFGTVFRIEFGPIEQVFHRYYCELKVAVSGMQTDAKWTKVK